MKEFIEILEKLKGKKTLVLCHDDADNDAIGAGFAMAELTKGTLAVPQRISEHALELINKLAARVEVNPNSQEYELVIVVDTADSQQLPNIALDEYLLIDHHRNNLLVENSKANIYHLVDSTCQLVYHLYKEMEESLTPAVALALAAGILGDTVGLTKASNKAIIDLGNILQDGNIGYSTVLNTFKISGKIERLQKLKAATSGEVHEFLDCVLIYCRPDKNFLFYVATMFLELGTDLALVSYQEDGWIHLRLVKSNQCITNHNVSEIVKKASEGMTVENFWGDQYFAGFKGQGDYDQLIKNIFEEIKRVSEQKED
ncbi:DHH family phosphoesterase [Alkalicella caledoniensis]|uniref:DHH family phosphoesterase n=1 Tax=Alkalicella caledoniensis TaxID=2731377 RepID=A0A7G9W768_ALKCA|nr:DHH family phosphoesterase [Alkalicella caledoniensis]QNO14530.1 DHH family phosphoesterase [Alkalicella caledoniensis]